MPNWCEGKLKIRGIRKDLINWLDKGLISTSVFGHELYKEVDIGELYSDNSQSVAIRTLDNHYSFYVDCTHRGFITESVSVDFWDYNNKGVEYIILDFKQAWDIDSKQLAKISNKYNIDLKIYAFECGMEFNRDIEIVGGKIIKDKTINFDDYMWDCINPMLGG